MAQPIDTSNIDVVGQGVNDQPKDTKVPRAGQVSSQATAAMEGAPQAVAPEQAPSPTPGPTPGEFVPLEDLGITPDADGYFDLDQAGVEVPDYANGSSPEFAINTSPLDLTDRLKLAAGNKAGNFKYLKQKYEDVSVDKDGNFKVKKDGSWYNVDPSGLGEGDAWEKTKAIASAVLPNGIGALIPVDPKLKKELAGDMIDLLPMGAQIVAGGLGATAGLVGGPVGSVAGAGLASGATEAARTSLGRLVGTYEATPEEQLKDIAWESLLGLGGQTVALAAKPTVAMMGKALSKLKGTSNVAKELISHATAGLNGQPQQSIRRALDAPEEVMGELRAALKSAGAAEDPAKAVAVLQRQQNGTLIGMANDSTTALQGKYRENLGNLLKATPDDFSVNVGDTMKAAMTDLVDRGIGRINDKGLLEIFSDAELAKLAQVPESQLPNVLPGKTAEAVREISKILNQYSKFGTLTGKSGAKKIVDLRKNLREAFADLSEGNEVTARIRQVVNSVEQPIFEKIGQSFADKGVGEMFVKMNAEYAKYADAAKLLQKAVNSKNPQAVDDLVKKLVSKSGSYQSLKDEVQTLAELVGQDRVQKLLNMEAAKAFTGFAPKASPSGNLISTIGKMTLGTTVASPRAAATQIRYGNKLLDFIKDSARTGADLASNDAALLTAYRTAIQGASSERAETQRLLQEAGIDPSVLEE